MLLAGQRFGRRVWAYTSVLHSGQNGASVPLLMTAMHQLRKSACRPRADGQPPGEHWAQSDVHARELIVGPRTCAWSCGPAERTDAQHPHLQNAAFRTRKVESCTV